MAKPSLSVLQKALGYRFKESDRLALALTHSSCKAELPETNERLEFVGDSVLGMVISEHLYSSFPEEDEGELTKTKSYVVSRAVLARVGRELGLAEHIRVGKGMASRKTVPASVVSNAFEALVAAIYFDGGLKAARKFVLDKLAPQIDQAREQRRGENAKSLLQQYSQREMGAAPTYKVLREDGPEHGKSFEVAAVIKGKQYGTGKGHTKKEAEQNAAANTLGSLLEEADKEK